MHSALGRSPAAAARRASSTRRNEIAERYRRALGDVERARAAARRAGRRRARATTSSSCATATAPRRGAGCTTRLRAREILAQVHYLPVYRHPWYRRTYGYERGLCPAAERYYAGCLSLPCFPALTEAEQDTRDRRAARRGRRMTAIRARRLPRRRPRGAWTAAPPAASPTSDPLTEAELRRSTRGSTTPSTTRGWWRRPRRGGVLGARARGPARRLGGRCSAGRRAPRRRGPAVAARCSSGRASGVGSPSGSTRRRGGGRVPPARPRRPPRDLRREVALAPGSTDVVHARFVLEHVRDPRGHLTSAREAVRPGGLVSVPRAQRLLPPPARGRDALGKHDWWVAVPDHVKLLRLRLLSRLLAASGSSRGPDRPSRWSGSCSWARTTSRTARSGADADRRAGWR